MTKLKVADFYYGSVLSMLFNQGIMNPALIEGNDDRQVYDFTVNSGNEYRLFLKYRADCQNIKRLNYNSWAFNISGDYQELKDYIDEGKNVVLALICSSGDLSNSELALLNKEQILQIIDAGKQWFTVSRKKGEKSYRIPIDGSRVTALRVKCNSFQELFG
ncbi:hypothetical protein [Sporolactobacillus vineae]|uniref:hypothetical protein n=1 Tax=Sporolactobacillus vineae TaxID=444463 RepID=UPI0002892FFC|nr:hypothetical protein [Sporolactobacillus vineae]